MCRVFRIRRCLVSMLPNCPKVARRECQRSFRVQAQRSRKVFRAGASPVSHRCKPFLRTVARDFVLHSQIGAPNDLEHSRIAIWGADLAHLRPVGSCVLLTDSILLSVGAPQLRVIRQLVYHCLAQAPIIRQCELFRTITLCQCF